MPSDNLKSLWARLPLSIREALQMDAHSPLQQWLNASCYDSSALLRYASTHNTQDAYAIILAAAVASVVDAANEERPIDLSYAIPLWHSLTEGRASAGAIIDHPTASSATHTHHASGPVSTAHIALGLSRGKVLNVESGQAILKQAQHAPTPLHLALFWFCIDTDVEEVGANSTSTHRLLSEWIRAFPDDRDLPIFLLRKYLDAARRVGVAGALMPLQDFPAPQLSIREAAWAIAWDEAARAGAHRTCAELALQRARQLKANVTLYQRWLLIHALHEEHREQRFTADMPVARELLDLVYEFDDPNVPASLCASIASRTNQLKPILREVLPYLKGPTSPLVNASLDANTRPKKLKELSELGTSGALLSLRIAQRNPHTYEAAFHLRTPRRESAPAVSILDDYESNHDFMREIFSTEETIAVTSTNPAQTAPSTPSETDDTRDASALESDTSRDTDQTNARSGNADIDDTTRPTVGTEAEDTSTHVEKPSTEDPSSTVDPAPATTESKSLDQELKKLSTGPFDHTIFATIATDTFTDETLTASENDVEPTVSDVLLAAFLPDALRARADQLLAQRITLRQLEERTFVRAIDERIALLPHSAWMIATLLADRDPPQEAKSWMKRAAEHTEPPALRDERYRRLARHCAQRCHDLSQAVHFLEKSLASNCAADETIALLDTIYTRLGRAGALRDLYTRALHALRDQPDDPLYMQWTARLEEINAMIDT